MNSIETFTPGKLFLAGEYFVVDGDSSAILLPLNIGITISVKKSDMFKVSFDKTYQSTEFNPNLKNELVVNYYFDRAIKIVFNLLDELKVTYTPIAITIESTLESTKGISYGFGSSGALVVGVIKSILKYYRIKYTSLELYKLAVLALFDDAFSSSFGDIALAAFNETIHYHVFDKEWFHKQNHNDILKLYKRKWKDLVIDTLKIELPYYLIINTKIKSDSLKLVDSFNENISIKSYQEYLERNNELMNELVNKKNLMVLDDLYNIYKDMSNNTSFNYMVKPYLNLEQIASNHNAIMKVSGAGGGDNVIFVFKNAIDKDQCHFELLKSGYLVFNGIIKE